MLVVSFFAMTGISFTLAAFGFAWHIQTLAGPYFQSELDVLQGITFLLAAFGVYRFDRRVRGFAIFLAALALFGSGLGLLVIRDAWLFGFLAAWLFVLTWLLSASTKAQFLMPRNMSKTA